MAGGTLNFFEARPVLKRASNKRRAHRVRGEASLDPNLPRVTPHQPIDHVGVKTPAHVRDLPRLADRTEKRPVEILAVPGGV